MPDWPRFTELVSSGRRFLITSHVRPDADAIGSGVLSSDKAEKVGNALGMTSEEILGLSDPGSTTPGLDALEKVGARSYQEARRGTSSTPPVVSDIAERIHSARRFLTHLADSYLTPIDPNLPFAAA